MAINLAQMRELMLPGLRNAAYFYPTLAPQYEALFADIANSPTPVVLSAKELVVLGTAAVIANNPVVTRRFLPG